jgi:hypothetical protein
MRVTTPRTIDTLPEGATADRASLDPLLGLSAEGAGLEPDPWFDQRKWGESDETGNRLFRTEK